MDTDNEDVMLLVPPLFSIKDAPTSLAYDFLFPCTLFHSIFDAVREFMLEKFSVWR